MNIGRPVRILEIVPETLPGPLAPVREPLVILPEVSGAGTQRARPVRS
jgi:hypothetical protein